VHARGIAGKPKVVKQTVESYARDTKALQLCQAGLTYDQINDQLQYGSRQNAHRAVKRRLDELHRECSLSAVELREKQLGEVATTKRTAHAVMGSKESTAREKLLAIDRLHNAVKLEAALCGTYAPTRNELTGRDGAPLLEVNLTDLKSMTDDQLKRALTASIRDNARNGAGAGDAVASSREGRDSSRDH
jgi:hypothetical protein